MVFPLLASLLAAAASADAVQGAADSSFQRFGGVPALAYAGETGWQIGGLGMVFLRPTGPDDPGSQIDAAAIWTTRGQYRMVIAPDLAFRGGRTRWRSSWEFRHWPGRWWSGGNEPTDSCLRYDMDRWRADGDVRWLVAPRVRLGLEYELERNEASFRDPDSTSVAERPGAFPLSPPERMGGDRVGLGWSAEWDGRDHDNWPTRGAFARFRQILDRKEWGADWDFLRTSVDLRGYVPAPLGSVFAFAGWWEGVAGDVPFDQLAAPDGTRRLRGLVKGRLSDRQELTMQGEVRAPLFWRFGATAFVEAGKVGEDAGELAAGEFHWAFGLGGRLALNPSRKLNVRGDLAWVDGGPGMTIYYKEAF